MEASSVCSGSVRATVVAAKLVDVYMQKKWDLGMMTAQERLYV